MGRFVRKFNNKLESVVIADTIGLNDTEIKWFDISQLVQSNLSANFVNVHLFIFVFGNTR